MAIYLFLFSLGTAAIFVSLAGTSDFVTIKASTPKGKPFKIDVLGILNGYYKPNPSETVTQLLNWNKKEGYLAYSLPPSVVANRTCFLQGAQLLIDFINSRNDLLPEYEIELTYSDPEIADMFLPQLLLEFEEGYNNSLLNRIRAPFFFGPVNGCVKAANSFLDKIWSEMMSRYSVSKFSGFECELDGRMGNYFWAPKPFNVRPLSNIVDTWALMAFAWSPKGGNWRQVGLMTFFIDSSQFFALRSINALYEYFQRNDIKVIWSAMGPSHYQMLLELKQHKARIIYINSQMDQSRFSCLFCIDIYCSAYKAGVTAPLYVLLFPSHQCLTCLISENTPDTTPYKLEICSKEIQFEQARNAIYAELSLYQYYITKQIPESNNLAYIENITFPTHDHSKILNQSGCIMDEQTKADMSILKDSLVSGILTLNRTEMKLQERYNTTIAEISKAKNNKRLAEMYVESANELGFEGSLGGTFTSNLYFESLIMQAAPDQIGIGNLAMRYFALVSPFPGYIYISELRPGNFSTYAFNYSVQESDKAVWATPNNKPPKDLSEVEHRDGSFNWPVFAGLLAVSLLTALVQLALGFVALRKMLKMKRRQRRNKLPYFDYGNNLVIIAGCLCLNIAVVLLLIGTAIIPRVYCLFRPLFTVLGMSLVDGMLFARMESMKEFITNHLYVSSRVREDPSLMFDLAVHEGQRRIELKNLRLNLRRILSIILAVSFVGLLVWLTEDSLQLVNTIEFEDDPIFDPIADTFFDVNVEWCESRYQWHFTGAFLLFHAILLFIATFQTVLLKRSAKYVRKRFRQEINRLRLATVNAATVYVFFIMVMLVMPKPSGLLSYIPIAVFGAAQLFFSLSTSLIVFSPFWIPSWKMFRRKNLNNNRVEPVASRGRSDVFDLHTIHSHPS